MRAPKMRVGPAGLAIGLLLASTVHAAEVRVTDDAGKPVVDAMVVCLGRETGAAGSGQDGIAIVPDACKEIYCERGDLVPDRALIEKGKAACRLRAGLVLTLEMEATRCADGCYAIVHDPRSADAAGRRETITGGVPRRADTGRLEPSNVKKKLQRRFRPLLPGRYRIEIERFRFPDAWRCGTDLGELPAGVHNVTAQWREPVEVKGRVLDREGKPVADVPLFVRPEQPTAGDPAGEWTCAARRREGSEPVTAEDGTFRVLIDPGASVRIDAGWEGYPIGTASVSFRGAPDRELVLRLK